MRNIDDYELLHQFRASHAAAVPSHHDRPSVPSHKVPGQLLFGAAGDDGTGGELDGHSKCFGEGEVKGPFHE